MPRAHPAGEGPQADQTLRSGLQARVLHGIFSEALPADLLREAVLPQLAMLLGISMWKPPCWGAPAAKAPLRFLSQTPYWGP